MAVRVRSECLKTPIVYVRLVMKVIKEGGKSEKVGESEKVEWNTRKVKYGSWQDGSENATIIRGSHTFKWKCSDEGNSTNK